MRLILLLLLILLTGCGESNPELWIEVGEPYEWVLQQLEAGEVEKIIGVGILCSPRCEWYLLPDGTALQVIIEKSDDGQ